MINGYVLNGGDPAIGTTQVVDAPILMSDSPMTPAHVAPELGQHPDELLLGYAWGGITALRDRVAI